MRVRFTDTAEADLEEIADYIAADNADLAVAFVMDVQEACFGLADHPHRFPLIDTPLGGKLRRRPFGNYLIFYRAEEAIVVISRIINAARDLKRMAFPED
jgi:plasmid stabilization system protein ParE